MAERARRWLSGEGTRQGPRIFTSTSSATTRPVRSVAVKPIAMARDGNCPAFLNSFGDVAADNLRYGRRPQRADALPPNSRDFAHDGGLRRERHARVQSPATL